MKLSIELSLRDDNKTIRSLIESIKPDNKIVPPNISISEQIHDGEGVIIVDMVVESPKDILRFRNTVDDILEHLILGLRVLRSVKDN